MAKDNKKSSLPNENITKTPKIDTKGQQEILDLVSKISIEQKKSVLQNTALSKLAEELENSWGDISNALTKVNSYSQKLGDNFSDVEDISKNLVQNLENVGSELYEQLDVGIKIDKLQKEQRKSAAYLKKSKTEELEFIKQEEDLTKEIAENAQKIADINKLGTTGYKAANKQALQSLETEKEKLDVLQEEIKQKKATNKQATEDVKTTQAIVKLQLAALRPLQESANALDIANKHAKDLRFNLDNATQTVTGQLSKSFDFMEDIPFLSDVIGLDSIKDELEKNVKDTLVRSMMAGKGAGVSMFSAMVAGARTLIATMAPLLPLILAAYAIYKAFEFDKELTQFSKDLDVSKDAALEASMHADHLATHLGMAGITGKEMGASIVALKEEFGDVVLTNDKLVEGVTMLRERMGLTNEEALALNSTATLLGTNLDELSGSSVKMSEGLIGGKQMLKEMAKLPKSLIAGFKGTTKELQKAVVKGKLFGLTLEKAQAAGEGMLEIETSLEKEMTFNILAGKSINLNKARQLTLEGKTAELQDEILHQAGSLSEFQEMGPIQQKAMAEALNMSKEELTEMLTKSKEMEDAGLSAVKVEEVLLKKGAERDALMAGMDASQKGYLQTLIEQQNREEATAKFQTAMNRLMEAFQKTMLPVIDLLGVMLGYVGNIVDGITKGVEMFNGWTHSMVTINGKSVEVQNTFGSILGWVGKIGAGLLAALFAINLMKKAGSGLGGMIKNIIPGKSKTPAIPESPDTSKMDKAKGKGSEGGLTGLASGLKAMGQSGVGKGILNTALAGPALLLSLPSIPFLAFIGKVKLDKLEANFTGLGNGLKSMDGTLKGIGNTGAFGIAGALAVASIPFLLIFGKIKLDKLEDNFTKLGNGLKQMTGTLSGSLATGAFGVAGLLAVASIPFLIIFGKIKLNTLQDNFTGLANGLKEMEGTMPGSAALAAFGAAGAISLLSLPFLLVFGKVKFEQLIPNFTSLSTGLQLMSGTLSGAAGLGAFALAATIGLTSLPFLLVFGKVTFSSLIPNFTGLAEGLTMMSATFVGSAALAAFGLAAIIAIPSLIFLGGIALLGAVASAGLIALGTGLASLGAVAATGLPFIAVGLIAALGLAMIPFGIALAQSAPGIKAFAEVLGSMGPIIIATFEGIGNVIDRISGGIAMIITTIATSIKSLSDINPLSLMGVAGGIIAVGAAIAGFGAGAGAGGLMAGIGKFFDEDPVEKFNRFASIDGNKLLQVAASIKSLGETIGSFGTAINIDQLDSVGESIDRIGTSIADFGAKAAGGGMMAGLASFFDEDPVDKFNRFATIDSGKLLEVASAIDNLGNAFRNFSASVSKIGDTSGITSTIDKVMELQDSIVSSPMENIVDSVSSAVDSVFAKASEFVSSIMPEDIGTSMTPVQPSSEVQTVQTVTPAPAVIEKQPAAAATAQQTSNPAAQQGSLKEVADLLKQLITATSQPVKINIGGKVIDEIEKQTTLRKTYNTKMDTAHGGF